MSSKKQQIQGSDIQVGTMTRIALKAPPVEVEFRGLFKVRLLLGDDGRKRVILGELADALGLQRQAFQARARRRFSKGCSIMDLPSAGGAQGVAALDLRYLPGLLVGVEVSRVRETIRPRLEEIQEGLYDALAAYTFEGVAVNPEFGGTQENVGAPEPRGDLRVALLEHHIPALSRAGDVDGLRAAVAALDALLDHQRTPHTPTPAPRRPSRGHFDHDCPTGQLPDHRQSARPSGSEGRQTRAPRPPAETRRKAPRATAPKDPAFAARIQAILDLRGWSSNKLGEAAGIGSGPMSKLRRRGPAEAGGATLTKVADAAGVELRWLVTGEGPMTSSTLN